MDENGIVQMLNMLGVRKIKRSNGGNIVASCPFGTHPDKTPSFSIHINPNGPSEWQCFACQEKANKTISILYKIKENGGGWREDIHQMIKNSEYNSPFVKMAKLGTWEENRKKSRMKVVSSGGYQSSSFEATFNEDEYKEIMSEVPRYALDRGFSMHTCAKWKLGYMKTYPERLFIPIYSHEQKLVGYSGRLINEQDEERYPKYKHAQYFPKEKYLYGENYVDRKQRSCFIMESFMDVLNLDQFGVPNCLAIMGTSISTMQIDKIRSWFDRVIILPHDDPPNKKGVCPGMLMAESVKNALELARLKVIISPFVPMQRNFGGVIRTPQDPGEWSLDDLRWVYGEIRRIALGPRSCSLPSGKEEEEAERREGQADAAIQATHPDSGRS